MISSEIIVGILTFMSVINYYFLSFEPEASTKYNFFNIFERAAEISRSAELSLKKFYILGSNMSVTTC